MKIALISGLNAFENFFTDILGISKEDFLTKYEKDWIFEYAKMLETYGIELVVYFFSKRTKRLELRKHLPSGCMIKFIPVNPLYKIFSHFPKSHPYLQYISSSSPGLFFDLKEERPSLIYLQEYATGKYDVVALYSKILNIPLIGAYQGGKEYFFQKPIKKITYKIAKHLLCINRDETKRMLNNYPFLKNRLSFVPNPIDSKFFHQIEKNVAKKRLDLNLKKRYVLFVGRLHRFKRRSRKGVDFLIETFHDVSKLRDDVELIIVGSGSDEAKHKTRVRKMGLKNVRFEGLVFDRKKLLYYYNASEFIVLPSPVEPFGQVIREAMACGKTAIGSNVGGIKDVIVDRVNGFLLHSGDVEEMKEKMLFLLDNPEICRNMGLNAMRKIKKDYTLESIGNKLFQIFKQAVEN